jgi:starch synthase (maltosyl-transferring)
MAFWEWLIPAMREEHPELIFLAEAFTRPKVMAKLAELGFSQSYTYFTWRNTKREFIDYLVELTSGPTADFMRPSFWTNTPDILSGPLRRGGRGAFKLRLVLASMMTPTFGMYSGYELMENEPASETNEEYLQSEKYEIKTRDWGRPDSLAPFVTRLNDVRRRHPALQELRNIWFHHTNNDSLLAFSKQSGDDVVLVIANLDPHSAQDDVLWIDLGRIGLPWDEPYEAYDELTDVTYIWDGPSPYVRLDPQFGEPAHVFHLRRRPW